MATNKQAAKQYILLGKFIGEGEWHESDILDGPFKSISEAQDASEGLQGYEKFAVVQVVYIGSPKGVQWEAQ